MATEDVTPGPGHEVTLALGFGRTKAQSVAVADGSLSHSFAATLAGYLRGWAAYDAGLRPPPLHFPGQTPSQAASVIRHYYLSANVLKASEDKTYPGAIVASLASPWGQSVPAGETSGGEPSYFGSYREVFARDLYEAFTGLLADGDLATARAAALFLLDRQQLPDGSTSTYTCRARRRPPPRRRSRPATTRSRRQAPGASGSRCRASPRRCG